MSISEPRRVEPEIAGLATMLGLSDKQISWAFASLINVQGHRISPWRNNDHACSHRWIYMRDEWSGEVEEAVTEAVQLLEDILRYGRQTFDLYRYLRWPHSAFGYRIPVELVLYEGRLLDVMRQARVIAF